MASRQSIVEIARTLKNTCHSLHRRRAFERAGDCARMAGRIDGRRVKESNIVARTNRRNACDNELIEVGVAKEMELLMTSNRGRNDLVKERRRYGEQSYLKAIEEM